VESMIGLSLRDQTLTRFNSLTPREEKVLRSASVLSTAGEANPRGSGAGT